MTRFCKRAFVVAIACLVVAGVAGTYYDVTDAESASAQSQTLESPVWVGIQVVTQNQEENDYLIGTIDRATLRAIELDEYDKRFLKMSNLRIEEYTDEEGENVIHFDCADEYDEGIILVQYKDVATIEFKKGDPLRVIRSY